MKYAASSNHRQPVPESSSSPALLRLVLLAFVAAVFFLVPAAQAAAAEFSLEINPTGSGEGAMGCKVDGSPLVEECESEYETGKELVLVAEPAVGSTFAEYDEGTGSATVCTGKTVCAFTIEADTTVEAVFSLEEFELTVETEGSGEGVVECQVDAGPYELCPESETYPYETEVTLFAESEEGSEFVEWGGDCSGVEAECTLTVEEPLSVTATFKPEPPFALTIETGGTGEGEVECEVEGEECEAEAEYEEGTAITLIAVPKEGSEFAGWNGECDSVVGNECEVEMNADKTVKAIFDLPEFKLTIVKAGTGSGSVSCNAGACAPTYPKGEEVTLAASAASGSTFAGWSGGSCSGTSSCKVTINADTTVTATFTANSKEEPKKEEPKPTPEGKAKAAATASVKSGKASLKLTCSGGPCKGTLQLTAKVKQGKKTKNLVIGKASFSLAEGATATLKVKLSGPAKQELAKGKTLKAKASGSGVTASTVKLKPPKKK